MNKPTEKPKTPHFASGPCAKRPGWDGSYAYLTRGRSHRSQLGKDRLNEVLLRSRRVLGIPDDYLIGLVPASDTGAVEMVLWNFLGARGVDVFAWESFGLDWVRDIQEELKIKDVKAYIADYGDLPNLSQADPTRDIVFTWNGTTSGVCVPDGDWISDTRTGLTICDATSANIYDLPWSKLDVTTYSWQKVMGGEAQHGIVVMSPRAMERLDNYQPPWPIPKLFRLKQFRDIYTGVTINTPSMLCVEDVLDALDWIEKSGGAQAMCLRLDKNLQVHDKWVWGTSWLEYFVAREDIRSKTSVCLKVVANWFQEETEEKQRTILKEMVSIVEAEGAGFDFNNHKAAPPSLRIWSGITIEAEDLEKLYPWIEYAYNIIRDKYKK